MTGDENVIYEKEWHLDEFFQNHLESFLKM
jgi:hypothetical protein